MAHNGNGSIYGQNGAPIPPPSLPRIDNRAKPEEWWFKENGRHYDTFRRGKYMFPMDEEEMDRMDIFHQFFLVARRGDSHYGGLCQRPLPDHPRILDLGCGTGIWVIDMADRHQGRASILGWDLSLIQPLRIPPGVRFERRDIEESWTGVEEGSFDLIRMSMLAGSIQNWSSLYSRILRYLKPGTGVFEHIEIDFTPRSEGGDLPEDSQLRLWARELTEAMARAGRPLTLDPNTAGMLQHLGYVDVEQVSKRIPFNSWPPEEHERELGRWFNLGVTQGLHALTIAPLTRMNGYDPEQVAILIERVRKEMCTRGMRAFCTMYVWTARRPSSIPGQRV
ncbi:methyltransferase LaeA [Durotheca rogersii]|uniref:methyltransferase LaeA n=1 Tax=Durotheca rogersii TaxID=419775 RepID=UPI002220E336|nr:methyltransferase LaeA [Durotheca rogersii]KAI5863022.1 methyltransferase LaeA [Durotheca rogersii]